MCYHTHYIFLSCGHSVSSPRPIHSSPPCPNRNPPSPFKAKTSRHHRPFSFDPSVIASPTSPHPEPFPAHTPWRLEQPFSTPDSAASTADEATLPATDRDIKARSKQLSFIGEDRENTPGSPEKKKQEGEGDEGWQEGGRRRYTSCGQVHIHPYRTYKLEGMCLHCRLRRDTRLASFEVNAIRDSVQRESVLTAGTGRLGMGRRFRAFSHTHVEIEGGGEGTFNVALPVYLLGQSQPFEKGRARDGNGNAGVKGGKEEEQQQQTPWRLTLPPAEPPRTGGGLAGMRDGEWI